MTAQDLVNKIDGLEYPFKLADIFQSEAIDNDLVVVYGASDDLMEFDGAIYDEIGACDGVIAHLTKNGIVKNICESDECPHFQTQLRIAKTVCSGLSAFVIKTQKRVR